MLLIEAAMANPAGESSGEVLLFFDWISIVSEMRKEIRRHLTEGKRQAEMFANA